VVPPLLNPASRRSPALAVARYQATASLPLTVEGRPASRWRSQVGSTRCPPAGLHSPGSLPGPPASTDPVQRVSMISLRLEQMIYDPRGAVKLWLFLALARPDS